MGVGRSVCKWVGIWFYFDRFYEKILVRFYDVGVGLSEYVLMLFW